MTTGAGQAAGSGAVNVEALLAPIAGENPAGASLQYDDLYAEIREARRADDQLSQGDWQRERKLADWARVVELASAALATRTKDLQLGAWLAEALVYVHGFEGLRDGLRVMRRLQLDFWEHVHPGIEDGDLEARANSLSWLDRQVSVAVRHVPLTDSPAGARYSYADWLTSREFDIPLDLAGLGTDEQEQYDKVRASAREAGGITSEQWRTAKNSTGRRFYEAVDALLGDCRDELQALYSLAEEKFADEAPGLRALGSALEDVSTLLEEIVREKRVSEPAPAPAPAPAEADATHPPASDGGEGDGGGRQGVSVAAADVQPAARPAAAGETASRAEAYRKLAEAAAYFRAAEPHSPVSYLIERAISWGRMPLEAWLAEVIKNDDVLLNLRETLGLKSAHGDGAAALPEEGDE